MEYSVGQTGRVILLRLDEDEDVLESLESLASKESRPGSSLSLAVSKRAAW